VKALRPFWVLLLLGQFPLAQSTFTTPSEAYKYANRPLAEWWAAVRTHTRPATPTAPTDQVSQRMRTLCSSYSLNIVSGEELYWLAKLCEQQNTAQALLAVQRYLAGGELKHRPEAHLLLAILEMRSTRKWEPAWGALRTVLEEDPIEPEQCCPEKN
jgi:hypothetical protein